MKLTIFDIDNWREISATLSRNRTRTFLTAFGIFWGTAMLTLLIGGAGGLKGLLMRNFEGMSTNMGGCFTSRTTRAYEGFNKGREWQLTFNDINFIRRSVPQIELSTALTSFGGSVKYNTITTMAQIAGVESDYFKILLPVIEKGRVLNESDVAQRKKYAVLGSNISSALFADDDPLGKFVELNGVYFMVIGVVSQTQEVSLNGRMENCVIIPHTTMEIAYNTSSKVGAFIFSALPGHSPREVEAPIRRLATAVHHVAPDDEAALNFIDISENFEQVGNLFLGVNVLALFVGLGTLLAGIIGVGNIMWIIVKERTQEIGIRRAIGAKPRDIIAQILSESMVMTTLAGTFGICFATLGLYIADTVTYNPMTGSANFQITLHGALIILITFLLLGTLAGLIPAIKAMRIKPIQALNDK